MSEKIKVAFSELRAWSDSASSRCSKTIRGSNWSPLPHPRTAPARPTKRPSAVAGRWNADAGIREEHGRQERGRRGRRGQKTSISCSPQ